jgi:alkanesulfonate monooxygenase SsuD/methylene tetrahydromethanopterin reductase-like flavin-dependent oxidoreductase (luciferase family)
MRLGLYIPPFDALADPTLVARLSAEAEEAGWDGVFVWDQVRWREPVVGVADPQITLAAIAGATERIRLGPMVTPLARRRPAKVARETATLDRLSDGRLTLGVGLGSDRFASEYSITGEELDDFLPRPVQRPGIPIWVAGFYGKSKPLRRAIRYQGFFPVDLEHPDQLAEVVAELDRLRREEGNDAAKPFDVAVELEPRSDPAPFAAAGATWGLVAFPWDPVSVDQVRAVIRTGPDRGPLTAARSIRR